MQVETRRQQLSGQGMAEYWAHHRLTTILMGKIHFRRNVSGAPYPYYTEIPDIKPKNKGDRNQVGESFDNNTVLLKLILLWLNVVKAAYPIIFWSLLFYVRSEGICIRRREQSIELSRLWYSPIAVCKCSLLSIHKKSTLQFILSYSYVLPFQINRSFQNIPRPVDVATCWP